MNTVRKIWCRFYQKIEHSNARKTRRKNKTRQSTTGENFLFSNTHDNFFVWYSFIFAIVSILLNAKQSVSFGWVSPFLSSIRSMYLCRWTRIYTMLLCIQSIQLDAPHTKIRIQIIFIWSFWFFRRNVFFSVANM